MSTKFLCWKLSFSAECICMINARHSADIPILNISSCEQVAVAVLVGLLTVSTWYFTHSYPKSAVASLSESLRLEILENTSELLDEIFSMNTYGSMAIANLMEKNFLGDDFSRESFTRVRCAYGHCLSVGHGIGKEVDRREFMLLFVHLPGDKTIFFLWLELIHLLP